MEKPNDDHVLSTIHLLNHYIRALTVNINREKLPSEFNLIFDSGAVNGIMSIGAALYIRHLEKLDCFKINKISGCSIGSIIALWYCYGCPETIYNHSEILFAHYKREKNFYIYESVVKDIVHSLIQNEDMSSINGRLYINYYDTKKRKEKVVSHFKNSEHLITCILRSSHVPFITADVYKYQGRYIDGIAPYIFSNVAETKEQKEQKEQKEPKNLFIKLINITNPLQCMFVKGDPNIYGRLLKGIVNTNDFFTNGSSSLCSYVDCSIHLQLYIRKYIVLLIICLIDWLIAMKNKVPEPLMKAVKDTQAYSKCVHLSTECWYFIQNKLV